MKREEPGIARRRLLAGATAPALLAEPAGRPAPLAEHGFWDYTTPGAGGMEAFRWDDYDSLLDDMAEARMNSLMVYVKWLTTGYRSRLPFQDQLPGNPVIDSDNELLRRVIQAASRRGIRVWLGAAVTYFEVARVNSRPYRTIVSMSGFRLPITVGLYDSDSPGLLERIVRIYEELVVLFPGISGLTVELEGAGAETPERIARYAEWAKTKGRAPFANLGRPWNPRTFDAPDWRDYTTESRLRILRAVEEAVRNKGFRGELSMICETGRGRYALGQEVNLDLFHRQCPHWAAVTYEYDKWDHRFAMMDLCIDQPRTLGMRVFYLPRGVMTWGRWPLPVTLEESWRLDIEDIRRFRPHGVWWFGCGTANEGAHVSAKRLAESGYRNPVAARRALLKLAGNLQRNGVSP